MTEVVTKDKALDFITGDFAHAWTALVSKGGDINRGNLMFAHQVGVLYDYGKSKVGRAVDGYLLGIDSRYGLYPTLFSYLSDAILVYTEAIMPLPDGTVVEVALTGALTDRPLERQARALEHLGFENNVLYVRTDQLFLDVLKAINKAGLC